MFNPAEHADAVQRIASHLKRINATVVAHFYTEPAVQYLAEKTGGFVGDSLAMAQFGVATSASTLMVAGVRFMGESAKVLSEEKRVLMPTLQAECSLDLSCPADKFKKFCEQHPDRKVVVYCNTSAAVKAMADWVVTSANAVEIVTYLYEQGEKILWASDQFLGGYIQKKTGADMLLWKGSCVVHEEFKSQALQVMRQQHPEAVVLVHPESPPAVVEQADVVGSTSHLLSATQDMSQDKFIVATDRGILYKMQSLSPQKVFLQAPTMGIGATCRSCGHCPWMAMNTLDNLEKSLQSGENEILLSKEVICKAKISLTRMLEFSQ